MRETHMVHSSAPVHLSDQISSGEGPSTASAPKHFKIAHEPDVTFQIESKLMKQRTGIA